MSNIFLNLVYENMPHLSIHSHRLLRRQMFIMELFFFFFRLMDYLVEFTGERMINHRCTDLSL